MFYDEPKNVIFVLIAKNTIASMAKGLLGKFTGSVIKNDPVGGLICYKATGLKKYNFTRLWEYPFYTKPSNMYWDSDIAMLAASDELGNIHVLSIATNKDYKEYSEFCKIKQHKDKIVGMCFLPKTAKLYTVSKDKKLILNDISKDKTLIGEYTFKTPISCFDLDAKNQRIFIGDEKG